MGHSSFMEAAHVVASGKDSAKPRHILNQVLCGQDLAEVEEAIGQHIWPLETLGAPPSMLRALRPLLFLDTAALPSSPVLGQLPGSCVLHHLYSRAPAELLSPHQRSGLSPAQVKP